MSKKVLMAKLLGAHGIKGEAKFLVFCDEISDIEKFPLTDAKGKNYQIKLSRFKQSKADFADDANSSNSVDQSKNPAKDQTSSKPLIAGLSGENDKVIIAKLEGINTREDLKKLAGTEFFTERKNFPATKENEFYLADLLDLTVISLEGEVLGKVIDVCDARNGVSLEIEFNCEIQDKLPKGYEQRESFLFKNEIFPKVSLEEGAITLVPPEFVFVEI